MARAKQDTITHFIVLLPIFFAGCWIADFAGGMLAKSSSHSPREAASFTRTVMAPAPAQSASLVSKIMSQLVESTSNPN